MNLKPHSLNPLTSQEIDTLVGFLSRVTPLPQMEWPILQTIWENRLMPMSPLEFLIFERIPKNLNEKNDAKILLTYRDDMYFPSCWHCPGGYLGANEFIKDAIQRIALREIKTKVKNISFIGATNLPKMERDHIYSSIFICEPDGTPAMRKGESEYFELNNLPNNFIPYQRLMLQRFELYFAFVSLLNKSDSNLKDMFLEINKVFEADNLK